MRGIRGVLVVGAVAAMAAGVQAASGQARSATTRAPTAKQITAACGSLTSHLAGPAAKAIAGSVPASVLAPYAALRRVQLPTDVAPALNNATSLADVLGVGLRSYDPADTRLVARFGTTSVFLLPGLGRVFSISTRCTRLDPTLASFERAEAAPIGTGPAYCLLSVIPDETSTPPVPGAIDVSGIQCHGFGVDLGFDQAQISFANGSGESIELVPDGVGAVAIRTAGQPTTTLPVANNIASGEEPQPSAKLRAKVTAELKAALRKPRLLRAFFNRELPTSASWLTAPGGAVVRTFPRPPRLLDQTIAEFNASEALLSSPGLSSGTVTTCSGSGTPGHYKEHCTSRKT